MHFSQEISYIAEQDNPYGCACYTPPPTSPSKLFLKRTQVNGDIHKDGFLMLQKPVNAVSAHRQSESQSAKISLKKQPTIHASLGSSNHNNSSFNHDKLRQTTPVPSYTGRFPEETHYKPRSVQLISSWNTQHLEHNSRNILQYNRPIIVIPQMVRPYTYSQNAASFISQCSPFPQDFSHMKSPNSSNSTMTPQPPHASQSKINQKVSKKISFQSDKSSQNDFFLNLNLQDVLQNEEKHKNTSQKEVKGNSSVLLVAPARKRQAISIRRLKENKNCLERMDDVQQIKSQIDQNQLLDEEQQSVVLTRLKQYNSSVNPHVQDQQEAFNEDFSFTTENHTNIPTLSILKPNNRPKI